MIFTADVVALIFAVFGVISLLYFLMFRFLSWREKDFTAVVPLFFEDEEIFLRIDGIRMFAEACSVHKKTKIAVVNYGAPESFLDEIRKRYANCGFLFIVDSETAGEEMKRMWETGDR